ncbi:uncharacterized protein LOC125219730 [Salvia hispanica]|uniref:uncharacterized protein LOC125219730 n=1 Tax=Salvia hispanica TaxID=49212 RepID=UPI00200951A2|nr:uncharacterized protein LOC125219730 [Salvia hispanica]
MPKEKGKRGRPAKKIPPQDSLAGLTRGTRKEHPQVLISANARQVKENNRGCKNDQVEKMPKEKGKGGKSAKKIPQQDSLAGLTQGTRKEHPQVSISANARQVKERALARKGVGVIGFLRRVETFI